MTRLTQILLAIIAALAITVYIQGRVITSQRRTIEHQRRSIEHGADIARISKEQSAGLVLMVKALEERGRADAEELARLKEQLSEPTPIPARPRTSEGMRRAIMEGVKTK